MAEYIDRDALKKSIGESTEPFTTSMVYRHINHAPAADVAPVVHAHWIDAEDAGDTAECSNCGECYDCTEEMFGAFVKFYHHCPNCGAKMED